MVLFEDISAKYAPKAHTTFEVFLSLRLDIWHLH